MKTEAPSVDALAEAVAKAAPDFDEEGQQVAIAAYRRLAEGSPAPTSDIAARADAPTERVEQLLGAWPGVFLDSDRRVVGFWGLTIHRLSPTHRIEAVGRELFAWCAWDTLFLPGILGTTLAVDSVCPTTAETISLVVSPSKISEISHPDVVVSFLIPEAGFDADVIQSFCHFVHFFVSREAGEAWTARHPGTFLLSLEDAFELARRVNQLNFPSVLGMGR
jgi:alkylmercury lyase